MSEKITIQSVAENLAKTLTLTKKDAETFVRAFVEVVEEGLEADSNVKVKGLGQFKLTEVADRESVAVATGERIVVPGYTKISFQPDDSILEMLNPSNEEIIEDAGEIVKERPADEFSVIDTLISTPETIDEVKERLDSAKRKLEEKRLELEHLEMTVAELSQTMYNLETNARPSYLSEERMIGEKAEVKETSENIKVSEVTVIKPQEIGNVEEVLSEQEKTVDEVKPEQKSVLTTIPKTDKEVAAERKREEERQKREETERKREEERLKREEEDRKRKEEQERREQERRERREEEMRRKEEERKRKEEEKRRKEEEKRRKKAEARQTRTTAHTKWWIFSIVGLLIIAAGGYGIWNAVDGSTEKEQPVVVAKPKPKPKPKPEWPKEYVLLPGETLYGVAERFYGDSLNRKSKENIQRVLKAHKAIIAINLEKKRFTNPDNVQDGTKLILPKVE